MRGEREITEQDLRAAAGRELDGFESMYLLLEEHRDKINVTEAVLKAAAGNWLSGEKVMGLLLEKRGDEITITEDVLRAAAENKKSGQEVMSLLLEKRGDEIKITEDVLKAAAENEWIGGKVMSLLLEQRGHEIKITEDILKAVIKNEKSGQEVMSVLLEKRGDEIKITEDILKAVAETEKSGQEVMSVLLEKRRDEIKITEDILKAMAAIEWHGEKVMSVLLEMRRDEIKITEDVLKAAAGNRKSGQEVMSLLLEKRGDEIKITEDVLKAAAENEKSGQEVMSLLFEKRGYEINVTEVVLKAAAGNWLSGEKVMGLLLEKRGDEITITEDVLRAAAGNKWSGQEVMSVLLEKRRDEIKITEDVLKAAAENEKSAQEVMSLLFEKRGHEIKITGDIVIAAAGNRESGQEVMSLLLEKRRDEIMITEDVLEAAAGNRKSGQEVMSLLLEKRGDEIKITEDVLKAAAGNRKSGQEVMSVLLEKRRDEIIITEDVLKAAAENELRGEKVISVLLEKRRDEIKITEDVLKAAAGNRESGQEVMSVLLEKRRDEIIITEDVLKAAAENEWRGGKVMSVLLEKRRDEIKITEDVLKAAVENEKSGQEVISILLEKRGHEIKITEDVLKAVAENEKRGGKVMSVLLEMRRDEIKITEDVLKAAAGNRKSGQEVMSLLLEERRDDVVPKVGDQFIWIRELQTIGYDLQEIAELLDEKTHDSPWIYFQPANISPSQVQQNHHLVSCAHQLFSPSGHRHDLVSGPASEADQERVVRRSIEELCGLGGISPFSRDASHWNGTVKFEQQNSVALLSHSLVISSMNGAGDVISRLIRVAEGFSTAASTVQRAGFCCDSFTILRHHSADESGVSPQVQLVRLDFSSAVRVLELLRTLGKLHKDGADLQPGLRELQDASRKVLSQIIPGIQGISESSTDLLRHSLHVSSLAIQCLCVSFVSYCQAHIGSIRPFFLDTPLQRIVLHGMETSANVKPHITASLVELTCLAGMAQGPVLVFDASRSLDSPPAMQRTERFDVRATPEDVLDTWGPGQLIFRPGHVNSPLAIKIGGGYISPPLSQDSNGKYHWDRILRLSDGSRSLDLGNEIVIGSSVEVNTSCRNDEEQCWKDSSGQFDELGTYRSYSEAIEYQLGIQGGPDHLAVTGNKVWAKRLGKTIKIKNLEGDDHMLISSLDFYWGVKVSFCTGVAQRVSLRELVADVLPAFAKTFFTSKEEKEWWAELETKHGMIDKFSVANQSLHPITDWLGGLSEELHRCVHRLVRQILGTLKDTGLSPDGTYFSVAWPWDRVINRCFRIPVDGHSKWTPMLADSDDCATFAYVSNACLQSGAIRCRGPNPTWQNQICLLETAVFCPARMGPWTLCHEQTYFFHKLDNNLFWVKAQKDNRKVPAALVRLSSIESFPQDIWYRLLTREERKQKRRLREKDHLSVTAEIVTVRGHDAEAAKVGTKQ